MNAYVRNNDPDTSHIAAEKATRDGKASRLAVLTVFAKQPTRPLADPQIYMGVQQAYGARWSPARIRHARLELERAGLLTRHDRIDIDGARHMSFTLTDAGRAQVFTSTVRAGEHREHAHS